jgi:hypothetical protein
VTPPPLAPADESGTARSQMATRVEGALQDPNVKLGEIRAKLQGVEDKIEASHPALP